MLGKAVELRVRGGLAAAQRHEAVDGVEVGLRRGHDDVRVGGAAEDDALRLGVLHREGGGQGKQMSALGG